MSRCLLLFAAAMLASCATVQTPAEPPLVLPRHFELLEDAQLGELYRPREWEGRVEEVEPNVIFVHDASWPERRVFFELGDAGLLVAAIRVEYVGEDWFERLVEYYTNVWGEPDERYTWRPTYTLPVVGYVSPPSYEIAFWIDAADTHVEIKRYLDSDVAVLSFRDLRTKHQ